MRSNIDKIFAKVGRPFNDVLTGLGNFARFSGEVIRCGLRPPYRFHVLVRELERVGINSIMIISLVGMFAGMVFALQTGSAFRLFNAESLVGSTVGIAVTRELAPVFTALMVMARACSAMAAELGTMKVTEQVDAMRAMSINPIQYLIAPKVIASTFMVPFLTGLFNSIGIWGSYVVSIYLLDIPAGPYMEHFNRMVDPQDVYQGLIKAVIFGFIISLIACYKGYKTQNGAEGVGKATTQAVVIGSVTVLISDYFLSTWLLQIFPDYP